jgi:hypothetical protein
MYVFRENSRAHRHVQKNTKDRHLKIHMLTNMLVDFRCGKVIRLKRIYNFWCSILVYTLFVLCFVALRDVFRHFIKLTYKRDATVPVPCFCCFCVSEKLHRKYSLNWTKQKPEFLFFLTREEVRRWDGGAPEAGRTTPWRGPPWHSPPDAALPPIYSPRRENLKGSITFSRNLL